jgi:hypothetical protein
MKRVGFILSTVAFLLGTLHGCASSKQHRDSLEYHTRFYEALMGLPMTSIVFVKEGICGQVGWRPIITEKGIGFEGPVIWYSLDQTCDPRATALHEVCHRRWMHHRMSLAKDVMESEVQDCMTAYRKLLEDRH